MSQSAASLTPIRVTSVQVTALLPQRGHAHAEDMHGIQCLIDHRTRLDSAPAPGQFLEASISAQGWVVSARPAGAR